MVFVRENQTESILVIASRRRDRHVEFPKDALSQPEQAKNLYGGGSLRIAGSKIRFEAEKLDFQIWRLPSAHR
jgi:alpha-glucosidase